MGATLGFRENLGFGVVSGDLGPQKAFAQIAMFWRVSDVILSLGVLAATLRINLKTPTEAPAMRVSFDEGRILFCSFSSLPTLQKLLGEKLSVLLRASQGENFGGKSQGLQGKCLKI